MEICCRNCHFLVAERWVGKLPHAAAPLEAGDRTEIELLVYQRSEDKAFLGCRKGIWVPSGKGTDELADYTLDRIREDREDNCFFVEYREGMSFEAADELQKLQYNNRHLERGYKHTQTSLRIAAIGLVLTAGISILDLAFDFVISFMSWVFSFIH
ncbi:MAG: hypothetical protein OXG26_11645 [Caldilineaceae bacterium]|nr:hypothetical protein [Caldilineaceae bacterium]